MTSKQMHIYKYVQSYITDLHQQVSVTPVTIRVSYNKNRISTQTIVRDTPMVVTGVTETSWVKSKNMWWNKFTNVLILGKRPTWRTVLFYVFISILYMFRATSCSSRESIVLIQHLVYVTLSRWPFRVQVGNFLSNLHTNGHRLRVTYNRCCIGAIDSPDDEHEVARNT